MLKQFLCFSAMLLMIPGTMNAQFSDVGKPRVDLKNIVPKSPEAAQIERLSEVTVNTSRGVPNISFNLYTATAGNMSIPISISYDASGIRYDDIPSSVGLKWSLQAGGQVSRNINGREDETYYFSNAHKYSQSIFAGWNMYTDSAWTFFDAVNTNNYIDIFQDEYSYNYPGGSGSFYYRNYKFWDSDRPRVTKIETDNFSTLHNYTITDAAGNKAYFGYGNEEISLASYTGSGYVTPNIPSDGNTGWKLTKLKAYTNQEALFEYDTAIYTVSKILSESYTKRTEADLNYMTYTCNCGTSSINQNYQSINFLSYVVKKITTPNEEVNFYYSYDNALAVYKKRLDSVVVKDRVAGNRIKKFVFKYSLYDNNYLRLDKVWQFGTGADSLLIAGFHYIAGSLTGLDTKSRDIFNYNNGSYNSYLISTSDGGYPYTSADRTINAYTIGIGTIDSVFYPTGGKAAFFYSPNKIGDTCAGGMKVDSLKYFNTDNSLASLTTYSYSQMNNAYLFYGTVNNTVYDNYNTECPVTTLNSEYNIPNPQQGMFNYGKVAIRKKGADSASTQLVEEFYTTQTDCYSKYTPVISKRVLYRNNTTSDTLQVDAYTYNTLTIDSIEHDWIYPAYSNLPNRFYWMDGQMYDNEGVCKVIYSGVGRYAIMKPRFNSLTSVQTKMFDQGSSSRNITTVASRTYNDYWQPVMQKATNSKGLPDSVLYNYLHSNGNALSTSAISANLYDLVDKTTRYLNGTQKERERFNYAAQSNGFIQPDSFLLKTLSNSEGFIKRISVYDTSGQVTEVEDKKGFYTSLLRNYNNQLVVAAVTNTRLGNTAYTSFEAESKGNWSYSGSTSGHATAPTGQKGYSLAGGNITCSGLSSSVTYVITYWKRDSSSSVTVNSGSGTLVTTKNGWKLYSHEITGTTSCTVSGTAYLDELRLYPKGAMMSTFTYNPLIGVSSECDASGRIKYYEYDSFGRLQTIKDDEGNILKKIDYKYQQTY